MAKLTLADLRKMREEKQKALDMRDSSNKDVQVVVGMGTCGIAAPRRRRTSSRSTSSATSSSRARSSTSRASTS